MLAVWGEMDVGSGGAAFLLEGALKLLREAFSTVFFHCQASSKENIQAGHIFR